MASEQSKYWTFTLNNWTKDEETHLKKLVDQGEFTYIVWGYERGEGNGTPHLQGYLELPKRIRRGGLVKLLESQRYHLEKRRQSAEKAANYCKKPETQVAPFFEWGVISKGQGSRTDLQEIKESLDEHKDLRIIAEEHFGQFIRYHRGFQAYLEATVSRARVKPRVVVHWGGEHTSGWGKSRLAYNKCDFEANPGDVFVLPVANGKQWFTGYNGQKYAIFDEYAASIPFRTFLQLLDRYPIDVPIHNGMTPWKPVKIFITAQYHPKDWYPNQHWKPLERRIDEIVNFELLKGPMQFL